MTLWQWFLVIVLVAGALVFLWFLFFRWLGPIQKARKWARRGNFDRAIDRLKAQIEKRPSSAALHATLGQIYLMAQRPREAEAVLRNAVALGTRNASHHGALGWALVELGKLDEALPVAEEANRCTHEDFEVHCLYCGLLRRGPGQRGGPGFRFPETKIDPVSEAESAGIQGSLRSGIRVRPIEDERCRFLMNEFDQLISQCSNVVVVLLPFANEERLPCRLHPV